MSGFLKKVQKVIIDLAKLLKKVENIFLESKEIISLFSNLIFFFFVYLQNSTLPFLFWIVRSITCLWPSLSVGWSVSWLVDRSVIKCGSFTSLLLSESCVKYAFIKWYLVMMIILLILIFIIDDFICWATSVDCFVTLSACCYS